jgi:hypothetical protein
MQLRARFSSGDHDRRQNRHDRHQDCARTFTSAACRRSSAPIHRDFADPLGADDAFAIAFARGTRTGVLRVVTVRALT